MTETDQFAMLQVCSVMRFLIVSFVFLLNLTSLIRLLLFQVRSNGSNKSHCVHSFTTGFLLCTCLLYVLLWLPHVALALYDREWSSTNALDHCSLQHLITGQLSTVLLAILTVRKIHDCFNENARLISLAVIFAWMLPQCIYLFANEAMTGDRTASSDQVDRMIISLPMLFANTGEVENSLNATELNNSGQLGFVFCVQKLITPVISHLSWHYVVLVIPLSSLIFLCFVGQALNKHIHRTANNYKDGRKNCDCRDDLLICTSLYFNLMWLLLLRPLIVLQTLLLRPAATHPPTYLDFGTHFVLVLACVFVPFSSQGGFRTSRRKRSPPSISSGPTCSYFEEDLACITRYRDLPNPISSRCAAYRY